MHHVSNLELILGHNSHYVHFYGERRQLMHRSECAVKYKNQQCILPRGSPWLAVASITLSTVKTKSSSFTLRPQWLDDGDYDATIEITLADRLRSWPSSD